MQVIHSSRAGLEVEWVIAVQDRQRNLKYLREDTRFIADGMFEIDLNYKRLINTARRLNAVVPSNEQTLRRKSSTRHRAPGFYTIEYAS